MKPQILLTLFVLSLTLSFVKAQTRETRSVGTFTKISFRVPGKVYLRQGSPQKVEIEGKKDILKEVETVVEGGRLVIGKEGKWSDWFWDNNDEEVKVYITVKDIEGLSVSGSGDIIGETRISAHNLNLNVSGSGNLKIEADASGDMEADVSGSGDLYVKGKCKGFNSDVSGSGKVNLELVITDEAEFGISGSGKIEAAGSASSVKASISGSGKVLAADLETNSCNIRISGSGDVQINVKNEIDATISGSGSVSYRGSPNKVNSHSSGSGSVKKM
ncbi:MAG TPA: head GIN domain-containing protein [Flavitalea sp.]|nr:head GIN domain-containing protein [Flavitalea sp.]